jgi:hypothetical protein
MSMIPRILASVWFLVGGTLCWFALGCLRGFGASQAAMSAGRNADPASADGLVSLLACSYFAVSAMGVLLAKSKETLRNVALCTHALLLVAFCILCSGGGGKGAGDFFAGLLIIGVLATVALSPWLAIWFVLLFKIDGPAEPTAPPNVGPTQPGGSSGVSGGPPSVS